MTESKTAIIVQARTGSVRLPRKVLLPWNNRTILGEVLERCMATGIKTVLAVPHMDLGLALFHEPCFVGNEIDVLDRYYQAALHYKIQTIIRITADCPFTNPEIINAMIEGWVLSDNSFDYYSNCHPIRTVPKGFDVEIFTFSALKKAWEDAPYKKHFREHVTPYLYESGKFNIGTFEPYPPIPPTEQNFSVDTREDYERLKQLWEDHYGTANGSTANNKDSCNRCTA